MTVKHQKSRWQRFKAFLARIFRRNKRPKADLRDVLSRRQQTITRLFQPTSVDLSAMKLPTNQAQADIFAALILNKHGQELWSFRQELLAKNAQFLFDYCYFNDFGKKHADAILSHLQQLTQCQPAQQSERPVLLLTDIDNTFLSSRDSRFQKQSKPYPGMLALQDALMANQGSARGFLTARPGRPVYNFSHAVSDKVKKVTSEKIQQFGVKESEQFVLWGNFWKCVPRLFSPKKFYARMSYIKKKNFEKLQTAYPGYQYVFFGDNGEADIDVGKHMLQQHPDKMKAVFIHAVKPVKYGVKENLEQQGIYLYRSILDAAITAHKNDLINVDQLLHIAETTVAETLDFEFKPKHRFKHSAKQAEQTCAKRKGELRGELLRVRHLVNDKARVDNLLDAMKGDTSLIRTQQYKPS